jgi:hypothetical protein
MGTSGIASRLADYLPYGWRRFDCGRGAARQRRGRAKGAPMKASMTQQEKLIKLR